MAVLVLTVNLKWNRLNFVNHKLLMLKLQILGAALVETCALRARESVLPLLVFAGLPRNVAR